MQERVQDLPENIEKVPSRLKSERPHLPDSTPKENESRHFPLHILHSDDGAEKSNQMAL